MIAFLTVLLLAESWAWQVAKGAQSLYIGGTCHVLRTAGYPLATKFAHRQCCFNRSGVRNRPNAPNLRVLNPCIFFVQSLAA